MVTTHLTVYVEGLIGLAPLEVPPPCRVCNQIKFISKYVYFSIYKMAKKIHLILLCNLCFCSFALCLASSTLLLSVNDSELLCSFDAVDLSDELAELRLVFSAVVGM